MARVAIIMDNLFEDSEFRVPYDRIKEAQHEPVVIGVEAGKTVVGKSGQERITTERSIEEVNADEYDALFIPGGYSPDLLRMDPRMVALVRHLALEDLKPVAAICHAPWMLIEAGVVSNRTVTSWPSIKTDLINAGARWVDGPVVEDGHLITARGPQDLRPFSDALLKHLSEERLPAPRIVPAPSPNLQEHVHKVGPH